MTTAVQKTSDFGSVFPKDLICGEIWQDSCLENLGGKTMSAEKKSTLSHLEEKGIDVSEFSYNAVRSSGPGGQNVNKVSSKVELRWCLQSTGWAQTKVAILKSYAANRITQSGEIIFASDEFRDQPRNKERCLEKLLELVEKALKPKKKRKPTKPGKGAVEKRIRAKKQNSERKARRSRVDY